MDASFIPCCHVVRQVVHTHIPLEQNSINWYQQNLGHKQAQCMSPVSVVLQHKLMSGRGLRKRRSMQPHRLMWLRKDFRFYITYAQF